MRCEAKIELHTSLATEFDAEKLESFISEVNFGTASEDCASYIVLSPNSNGQSSLFRKIIPSGDWRLDSGGQKNDYKQKERGDDHFDGRGSSNWREHLHRFMEQLVGM